MGLPATWYVPLESYALDSPQCLLTVTSPSHDISRTHLLVSPDDWEIRLTDLHSTNGTIIVRPGPGVERLQLQPGEPYAVVAGTVVELGDGVAVLVDGPPAPS